MLDTLMVFEKKLKENLNHSSLQNIMKTIPAWTYKLEITYIHFDCISAQA